MTPPKDKQRYKYRPATVVYQRMTPELMLAYRIFSPGLADQEGLDKLNMQMQRIIEDVYVREEVYKEDGKSVRRGVGMFEDLRKQMNVTESEIKSAYDAYKAEIERMIEEDRAHLSAKARGELADDNSDNRGTKRKSPGGSSSSIETKPAQRKSPSSPAEATATKYKSSSDMSGGSIVGKEENGEGNNENEQDIEDDNEGRVQDNRLREVPTDRWMTKAEALAKLADAQRRVGALRSTIDVHHDYYTTQMIQRYEVTTTFQSTYSYLKRLREYVQEMAEVVEGHDGDVREGGEINIWEDDRTAVTKLVLELIPMIDEIPLRLTALEGILQEVSALMEQFAKSAVEETRRKFRMKLAKFVRQCHTPVPPHYCDNDIFFEDSDEEFSDVSSEESPDKRCSKRAKTGNHEVITIDDD